MKRIRNSRAARFLSWLLTVVMLTPLITGLIAPPSAYAQTGGAVASGGNLLTVIVVDFVNKDKNKFGGDALARFATDAVAVEMSASNRFEVLKRDEVIRTANELGFRAPYDMVQLQRIATQLGAAAIVNGEVAYVRADAPKGRERTLNVGVKVQIRETSSGENLSGAAEIGSAIARPGQADDESLAQEAISKAAVLSVRKILAFTLPEGIILNIVGTEPSVTALINRGASDGVKPGMEMLVMRDRQRVGKLSAMSVFPRNSECKVLENIQGLRTGDTIRAVFPMPDFDPHGKVVNTSRPGRGSSVSTLGKVLLVILIGIVIATTIKGGGTVTGVTAEADIENGTPVVRIIWRDNLFSGQVLEYHIWRTPGASFNFGDTPVASQGGGIRQYTDRPAPFSFWNGVNQFLQAPAPGSNTGGGTGGGTGQTAAATTPAAGSVLGFTLGQTVIYQLTTVLRRQRQDNSGQGGQGGQGGQQIIEDVESDVVASGPVTPIPQPQQGSPSDTTANLDLRNISINFNSVAGADTFVVEFSTDRLFKDRNRIVQSEHLFSSAPNSSGVVQTFNINLLDPARNGNLRNDPTFRNFVNGTPGAPRPQIFWRIGARNEGDRPGPVHWITRNPKDEDRTFRFIYSNFRSFTPADVPPPPP